MTLHIQTAFTISCVVTLVLGGLELLAWWRIRREPALLLWAASNALYCVGIIIQIVRHMLPLPVTVLCGSSLLIAATGLLFSGMRAFDGRPLRLGFVAGMTGLGVVLLAASLAMGDNLGQRIVIISLLFAGWTLMAATSLAYESRDNPLFSRSLTAACLGFFALLHLIRVGAVLTGNLHPTDAIGGTPQVLLVLCTLALGMVWNFGGLLMVFDRMASTDDLTGLANRRGALNRAATLLRDCNMRGRPLSVLLVDLDHFKQVNDRFGHRVGDHVLARFAQIARQSLRPADMLGRHGGEEFLIVLPDANEEQALAVAERVRLSSAIGLMEVDGYPTACTVAIGLATYVPSGRPPGLVERLIDAADTALYEAKSGGRNRVIVARPNPIPPRTDFTADAHRGLDATPAGERGGLGSSHEPNSTA